MNMEHTERWQTMGVDAMGIQVETTHQVEALGVELSIFGCGIIITHKKLRLKLKKLKLKKISAHPGSRFRQP